MKKRDSLFEPGEHLRVLMTPALLERGDATGVALLRALGTHWSIKPTVKM